jgi:DNA helicase-2/ATP-dependent DNA helicase PcrA
LINKIRSDDVVQEPISQAKNNGSVEFFSKACADADKFSEALNFIDWYKKSLGEGTLHCLVLTNKIMARLNGFGDLYDIINQAGTIDWRDINTQLLSNELEKLNSSVLLIYRLVNWYKKTQIRHAVLNGFIGNADVKLNLGQVIKLAQEIRNTKVLNLKELIAHFSILLKNNEIEKDIRLALLNQVISQSYQINIDNFESIFDQSVRNLLIKNQEEPTEKNPLELFYSLPFEQFSLWVDFINKIENKPIIYHTYHGTKGEEYENVAIIMEHSFGSQGRDKFKNYFRVQQLENKSNEQIIATCNSLDEYGNTKNLMYVACSRAIKNLKILYLDDISDIEQGIKNIFLELKQAPI